MRCIVGNEMPLTIVRNVTDDKKVMQEEIFGPILPRTDRTLARELKNNAALASPELLG